MKSYFIVGTDTDSGKTYVTRALIDYYRQQQHQQAIGLKPVASGCTTVAGTWVNEDVAVLEKANGRMMPPICKWLFPEPIAPHLAAKAAGVCLLAEEIMLFCRSYPTTALDYLLIEGAGGLMVPLNATETWIDFLKQSQFPVILVVGMRLGCINHALLTSAVLHSEGLSCAGWIANFIDPHMAAAADNLATLVARIPYPLLGTVPFAGVFLPKI